jgi:hypothetical protein
MEQMVSLGFWKVCQVRFVIVILEYCKQGNSSGEGGSSGFKKSRDFFDVGVQGKSGRTVWSIRGSFRKSRIKSDRIVV